MLNKNQVFFIILAIITGASAIYLKEAEPISTAILAVMTAALTITAIAYRNKPKQTTEPEILPPNQAPRNTYDILPFDQKLVKIIDDCLNQIDIKTSLNAKIELPLPTELDYRGTTAKITGNLTLELNSTNKQDKDAPAATPAQLSERSIEE